MKQSTKDVIVIGGGQSALAVGYYLRKTNLDYVVLDQQKRTGGNWLHYWESLRLFSPAQWSSLPGVLMPGGSDYYPSRDDTIRYLEAYETWYQLPIERSVTVETVRQREGKFVLATSRGEYRSRAIISATGSFQKPYIPPFPGQANFQGSTIHSADYRTSEPFQDKRVLVVGEGNSGAQILAEVSQVAQATTWVTLNEPQFLPDEVTGRDLFDYASAAYQARKQGKTYTPPSLGNIVMVPSVRQARQRGVYQAVRPFVEFTSLGVRCSDGREETVDAVIFCTGFHPALDHLNSLGIVESNGKVATQGTKAEKVDGLWLVGYGSWTGFASATLIGVGRSAKQTASEVSAYLNNGLRY
ncbi:MAG: ArsO family NAD(P)H-dependent flavin-containing monooxygenase [Bacteroidota bacterium]